MEKENRSAVINARCTPSLQARIRKACSSLGWSVGETVLSGVLSEMVTVHARLHAELKATYEALPDGPQKDKFAAGVKRAHEECNYFAKQYEALQDTVEVHRELECLTSYRDFLASELDPVKVEA